MTSVERGGGVVERRQHARITLKGTVLLFAGEHVQRGRLVNLSQNGLLAATIETPPDELHRRTVDLELRLDGLVGEWLRVSGRIARIAPERVAVAFERVPHILVQLVDDMTAASRVRRRILSVVLIDADPDRLAAIADGFARVGCQVICAATSLEAIVRLGEASFEPDLIAVGDSLPAEDADAMRRFVERDHPHVKLVAIGESVDGPVGLAHWLSSTNPDADLVARIRQLLARPLPV